MKTINYVIVITITLLCSTILMIALLLWGKTEIDKPFIQQQVFNEVKSKFFIDLNSSIESYLQTSDASLLLESEKLIQTLAKDEVTRLPESVQDEIHIELDELLKHMQTKVRAAGKSSGNIDMLLVNAEREMLAETDSALGYAIDGVNLTKPGAATWIQKVTKLSKAIEDLRNDRILLLGSGISSNNIDISASIERTKTAINDLRALTPLELYTESEEDDDDFFGFDEDEEAEERSESFLSELSSLINRYPKEITNTTKQLSLIKKSQAKLKGLLKEVKDTIASSEKELIEEKNFIERKLGISFMIVFSILFGCVGFVIWVLVKKIMMPLRDSRRNILKVAEEKDLTAILTSQGNKDLELLIDAVNTMQQQTHRFLLDTQGATATLSSNTTKMTQLLKSTTASTIEQEQEIDNVNSIIGQVAQKEAELANLTESAFDLAHQSRTITEGHSKMLERVSAQIDQLEQETRSARDVISDLEQHSNAIEDILDVIIEISEQTNLLALNAAIEAARAGDHGRGFAVVADEVRTLATRTHNSTEEIRNIVDVFKDGTKKAVSGITTADDFATESISIIDTANSEFNNLIQIIEQLDETSNQITVISEQQKLATEAAHQHTANITESIHKVSQQAKDTSMSCENLEGLTLQLESNIKVYKI